MANLQIYLPDGAHPIHELPEEKLNVGRLAGNELHLQDASISSHHAEITFEAGEWHLHDVGSTNGTFVNGERVTDAVLRHGDQVRFGVIETVFNAEENQPDQPLPESSTAAVQAAHTSSRPLTFMSSSPIPKNVRTKDLQAMALIGAAIVGLVVFGAAAFLILQMVAPA